MQKSRNTVSTKVGSTQIKGLGLEFDSSLLVPPSEFQKVGDLSLFNPERISPLPKPEFQRIYGDWWVRCSTGKMIDFSSCYESFMEVNALSKKCHGCHNCPLGKNYREMHSAGAFSLTRFDTLLQ